MKFIIAKKIEMSQRFRDNGNVVPVTLLQAGPCVVAQIKTKENDGYDAVQFGWQEDEDANKPATGHGKAAGKAFKVLKEFRLAEPTKLMVGDVIDAGTFSAGEIVDAMGMSKGKGFQGVVKRHGFGGGPRTHGHKDNLRMPGSIGSGGLQRVLKGLRMGGRMGGERVTVKNLEVVDVDAATGIIAIKGAVPGVQGSTIIITGGFDKKQAWK